MCRILKYLSTDFPYQEVKQRFFFKGQTTVIKQEVCTEENVTLECDAKHRANPSKIKRVMWHKKDSDGVWSMVAASDRGDLGQNSSLVLQAGRKEGKEEFRCAVSKNYTRSRDERHLVVLTNIQCRRERGTETLIPLILYFNFTITSLL